MSALCDFLLFVVSSVVSLVVSLVVSVVACVLLDGLTGMYALSVCVSVVVFMVAFALLHDWTNRIIDKREQRRTPEQEERDERINANMRQYFFGDALREHRNRQWENASWEERKALWAKWHHIEKDDE